MKKICACFLALAMVVGITGCSSTNNPSMCSSTNNPSIDELKDAMEQEKIEFDYFDIQERDEEFFFIANGEFVSMAGLTDKNENVTAIIFVNSGTNSAIFETKATFEQWYTENVKDGTIDYGQTTMGELKANIVALSCIDELKGLYSLFQKDDAYQMAVNTLLEKEASEIEGWSIGVSVAKGDTDTDDTIFIEVISNDKLETGQAVLDEIKDEIQW